MARQSGPILLEGTIAGITFYQVDGKHYAKKKNSPLSKRRYKSDPRLARTRQNASWFALAQKMARLVYATLPKGARSQKLVWYPLRNKAQELVRKGLEQQKILKELQKEVQRLVKLARVKKVNMPQTIIPPDSMQTRNVTSTIELGRYYGKMDPMDLSLEAVVRTVDRLLKEKEGKSALEDMREKHGKKIRETKRRRT